MIARSRIAKRKRGSRGNYERMMETLLLQNQQLIIQQQNMLFMFIKQNGGHQPSSTLPVSHHHHHQPSSSTSHHQDVTSDNHQQQQQSHHLSPHQAQPHQQQHHHHNQSQSQSQQQQQQQQPQQLHQQQQPQSQQEQQQQQQNGHNNSSQHHHTISEEPTMQSHHHQIFSQASNTSTVSTQQQLQQVAAQLHEHQGSYLTPAASEQDPISDKQEEEDLAALLDGDGLLHNNFMYNPQTDIGSITPYKSQPDQHQTPSYYSSGCESLTTPRMDQPRPAATANINQNVVKNLADSFKSPTKPKINVQIMSSSATGCMKNSKAKIIQSMNISQFLRHVHPEVEKNSS